MMNEQRLTEYIHNVLISIHENIREIKERKNWADPKELAHIESKLLTYHEVIQIFKFTAKDMGLDEKELGL